MIKLIWSKLTNTERIGLIVISILLLFMSYQSVKIARLQYLRVKNISEQLDKFTQAQEENNKKTDNSINKGKSGTSKAVNKNKAIDKKLQDEKTIIDNTDYPDVKLDSLLSGHQN